MRMRKKLETSLRTIASEAGVAVSTVSRVLNNHSGISDATRRRVMELLRKYDFFYRKDTRDILVILPNPDDALGWYGWRLLDALRREAQRLEFRIELVSYDDLQAVSDRNFLGAISIDYRNNVSSRWRRISALPLVCLNDFGNQLANVPTIYSDERLGMDQAVTHLVGYNHRRIGLLLDGTGAYSAKMREQGYLESMARHHLSEEALIAYQVSEPFGPLDILIRGGATAIIAPMESGSVEVLHSIRSRGIRIPQDLSLITWELRHVSEYQEPPLTTLEQDYGKMALLAFETLEKMANGLAVPQHHEIGYRMFRRASVSLPSR